MTDSQPGRPAVTRRNVLRLADAAIPAAALLISHRHLDHYDTRSGKRKWPP